MICIRYYRPDNHIARVANDDAHRAVKSGKAIYVQKHVWKEKVRDAVAPQAE